MSLPALDALNKLYSEPETCAPAIGLNYQRDDGPGFGRRRCGKGFAYRTPGGTTVSDDKLRQRFDKLAIPPAWKQVWISPDPDSHLQATGIDEAGRKQYLYHGNWQEFRNRLKFYHLIPFTECLPKLRRQAVRSLRTCPPASADNVLAAMVLLLDKGALRIGNEVYYETNESVGLTTLLPEHLNVSGADIALSYVGKHGQAQQILLADAELASVLNFLSKQGGPRLFCYRDATGGFCNVSADTVNHYLQAFSPCAISAKDFRTWKGTLLAYEQMLAAGSATPPLKQIVEQVADALGNTPAVAQNSYIHPDLLTLWKNGEFSRYRQKVAGFKARAFLSRSEHQLQELLKIMFRKYMQPELPEAA